MRTPNPVVTVRALRDLAARSSLALIIAMSAGTALADLDKAQGAFDAGDFKLALSEYNRDAGAGKSEAMFMLGRMYGEGRGVKADTKAAFQWMEKSAKAGYVRAQSSLGMFYSEGIGVEKDDAKSLEWGKRAADAGDVLSQFIMGMRHAKGLGVESNQAAAIDWWEKAANQGFGQAQSVLAASLAHRAAAPGAGTDAAARDRIEALKWTLVAGRLQVGGAEGFAATLKEKMSAEEIASADKKALEWQPAARRP